MAVGERFRSGGARGIARFLAEHQHCDDGFDVRRDEGVGSGRLRITCQGCGKAVDYRAAEAGELAAGGLPIDLAENGEPTDRVTPPGPMPGRMPLTRPPARAKRKSAPERRGGGRTVWGWLSVIVIGLLIIGGLTMIAIGVLKEDGEQAPPPAQSGASQEAPEGEPAGNAPEGNPTAPEADSTPAPTPAPTGNDAPAPQGGTVALERRSFANRFTIGVPVGWSNGTESGAIALTAPGATAEIDIFFEPGERPPRELAAAASGFLADRHNGAQVGAPRPFKLGTLRTLRIHSTYPGGEEDAVLISAGGFSHLVLCRIDRGASPDIRQQANAALVSLRLN